MSSVEPSRPSIDPALADLVSGVLGAVHRWSPLGAGTDHRAWQVDTDDGTWVIRRPLSDAAPVGGPGIEARLTQAVRAAGIRWAPEIRTLDPLPGQPAGVTAHRFVPGRSLLDVLASRPVAERELVRLGRLLGEFVRDVGHLAPDGLDLPLDAPDSTAWLASTATALETAAASLDREVAQAVERFLAAPPPSFPARAGWTVVHHDLGAEHVLVDGALGVTGIIDWSDAAVGDPAHDLGCVLRDLGEAAFRAAAVAWATPAASPSPAHARWTPLPVRARWYARCLVIEDLAFDREHRPHVVDHAIRRVRDLFLARRR